jgi:kynurenine formamidase
MIASRFGLLAVSLALGLAPALANAQSSADLIATLRNARIIDLSHLWERTSPIASVNPPYSVKLDATHGKTRGMFKDGDQLSFASERMEWSGQHGAPTIDALGHIARDGKAFGGLDATAVTANDEGIGASGVGSHLGIDSYPVDLLVNRAVLLDVAGMVNGNSNPLPAKFEITAKHLEEAAAREKVTVRKGDTVFIRTGWGQYFKANPSMYLGENSPGPGVDAAAWLVKSGARVVGDDTATFEQRPPIVTSPKFQVFPVHMQLIADSGVYIIENLNLEELAQAKVYEFPVVVPPLKVKGGTGSALRAFALVPRQ